MIKKKYLVAVAILVAFFLIGCTGAKKVNDSGVTTNVTEVTANVEVDMVE